MAKPRRASDVRMWVCDEGHVHISLLDSRGNEFATAAVDPEASVDMVYDLVESLEDLYGDDGDDDPIGPTVGNA